MYENVWKFNSVFYFILPYKQQNSIECDQYWQEISYLQTNISVSSNICWQYCIEILKLITVAECCEQ